MSEEQDPEKLRRDARLRRKTRGKTRWPGLARTFDRDPGEVMDAAMRATFKGARREQDDRKDRAQRIGQLSHAEFARLDGQAARVATEREGPQPQYGPIPVGIFAYMATSVVPWLGLEAAEVMNPSLDVPLVVTGLVAAVAAGLYQRHRSHRWAAARHRAFDELLDGEQGEKR